MTWRIDISHSVVLITYSCIHVFFRIINYSIPSLHQYTGKWICYVTLFFEVYCRMSILSHSLVIVTYKYLFITHQNRIRVFGSDKASAIIFWTNLILPAVYAVLIIARPYIFPVIHVLSCLGMEAKNPFSDHKSIKHLLKQELFCGFDNTYGYDTYWEYVMNTVNLVGCFSTTLLYCIVRTNIIEIILYRKLFTYMKR